MITGKHKILVTGAAGFIGSHLAETLAKDPNNIVYATDIKSSCLESIEPNLFVSRGIDLKKVTRFPDVDVIFHMAAFNGTKFFYEKPYEVINDNILPTINLLNEYSARDKKPLFIYAGTPEATAGATQMFDWPLPTTEEAPYVVEDPKNPRWSYANSKALGEQAVIHNGVLEWIAVRPQNVYGPRQKDHFISEFVARAKQDKFTVFGGINTRTFLYIDDCVDAFIKLWKTKSAHNDIYNLGGNTETSIHSVASLLMQLMEKKGELVIHPAPKGSVNRRWPDITKIKKAIDWEPTTELAVGLGRTLETL